MPKTMYVAVIRGKASIACEDPKALRMWIADRAERVLYTIDTIPVLTVKPVETKPRSLCAHDFYEDACPHCTMEFV